MEILNLNFAIFVVQLAFCIVPIAMGIRLFTLTSEKKHEISQKLSKKILGEADLIKPSFYNFVLYLAGEYLHFNWFSFYYIHCICSFALI